MFEFDSSDEDKNAPKEEWGNDFRPERHHALIKELQTEEPEEEQYNMDDTFMFVRQPTKGAQADPREAPRIKRMSLFWLLQRQC